MTKEKLKELYFKNIKNYDSDIIILLESDLLNDVIEKINNLKRKKITSPLLEKFLLILNLIIVEFKKYFIKLYNEIIPILEKIISTNEFEILELLLSENDINDEETFNSYYIKNVHKILISNFIRNIKLFPQTQVLLKKQKINYKGVDDYSIEEIDNIINLLSNIVFSSSNNNNLISLFTYFNFEIYSQFFENKNTDLNEAKKSKNEVVKIENEKINKILKEYYHKKKYLKYFK